MSMRMSEDDLARLLQKRSVVPVPAVPTKPTSQQRMQALGRLKSGEMNKTEQRYAEHLAARLAAGEIKWFKFEGIKLRLADNTFYSGDFAVMAADGVMEIHEVKGFMLDDGAVKLKVAADQYPFRFFLIRAKAKKDGGGWDVREVG